MIETIGAHGMGIANWESGRMTDGSSSVSVDVGGGEPLVVSSVDDAVSASRQLQDAIERCMNEFESCERRLPSVPHDSPEAHAIRLESDSWLDRAEALL